MLRIVLAGLVAYATAQSPGNGISKTTMACNDPIPGKTWLYKYFPVATPGDECSNDICECPAGTGGSTTWYIQQGRVYALTSMDSANATTLRGRRMPSPGNGFGMHLVNVSNHLTTGGLSVKEVEDKFADKLGDMSKFDSFMDFNAFFYTTALSTYVSTFKSDGVPMYTCTWEYNSKTWTSVFVHVPNSQLTLELCQDTTLSEDLVGKNVPRHPVRRASPSAIAKALSIKEEQIAAGINGGSAIITPLAVNRGISKAAMAKLDDFYVTGMKTKSVDSSKGDQGVTKKCYLWDGASVDVCFYNRDPSETKGDWKIADFEDMLHTVHTNILGKTPLCGEDKWFDNHYAIDSFSTDTSNIVPYIEKNNVLHYCSAGMWGGTSVHYVFDPTGWGIQLDLQLSSTPSDCSSAAVDQRELLMARASGHGNPACSPGTC